MMISTRLRNATLAIGFAALSNPACAQQADFNEVGKQMAIMLQNSHFARLPYNAELSRKFFEDYLKELDSQKLYFTQQDVDGFSEKYRDKLHTLLLQGNSMAPAAEIYDVFKQRVATRVGDAQAQLKGDFDFTTDETVTISRKEANWSKDEAEAKKIWAAHIKEAVLSETLRREMIAKMAKEQESPTPAPMTWIRAKK